MNLNYLVSRADRRVAFSEGVRAFKGKIDGRLWRGVYLPGDGASITVKRATECQPFRSRPGASGWYAQAPKSKATLEVAFLDSATGEAVGGSSVVNVDAGLSPIALPWPLTPCAHPLDLKLSAPARGERPVFVATALALDREPLLALCRGRGFELGPGPVPQIINGPGVDVRYVEQKAPDEWVRLYGSSIPDDFDESLLQYYIIGDAHRIPAEPESLDFIFSSHVFEHLANPLGHLKLWRGLLRPGGRVVMIVPDYIGAKDFLMDETEMSELIQEYESGSFDVELRHYQAYGRARANAKHVRKMMEENASIHVHFYTNTNMARVCEFACDRLGYSAWSMVHTPNHKDFYVVLSA